MANNHLHSELNQGMNILIIEDEIRIAKLLERLIREVWGNAVSRINHVARLEDANRFLKRHPIDLLFLDLNLNGQNGFDILKDFSSQSFHTVIVSAYKDRAIEAFEYGVLDFIPKPFSRARLEKTYARLIGSQNDSQHALRFIAVKKSGRVKPVPIQEVRFIKADGHYTELHLSGGKKELSDKPLDKLEVLLPASFLRIHRSYIVQMNEALEIKKFPGSKYQLLLKDGSTLPIGRSRLKNVEERMI